MCKSHDTVCLSDILFGSAFCYRHFEVQNLNFNSSSPNTGVKYFFFLILAVSFGDLNLMLDIFF